MGGGLVVTTNTYIERKIMLDRGFSNFGKVTIEVTPIFVKWNHD
jgi:hypothetical protein